MDLIDTYLRARGTAEQLFVKRKLVRMTDTGDSDGSKQGLSPLSTPDKGNRNKRKYLSDFSLDPPANGSSLSLTEFPRYEVLEEKFRQALWHLESMEAMPGQAKEELGESKPAEWDDPIIPELEVLLANSLTANYRNAIKKIAECGYSEEVAEWVVLRSGPYFGSKDIVSNIVDGALDYLKTEKEFDTSRRHMFEDLENLVEYTMLEMTCVLREVKPSLSVADAMWCLLIFDLNLPLACAVEGDPQRFLADEEIQGESSSDSTLGQVNSEPQKSELTVSNPNRLESEPDLPSLSTQLAREPQMNEKDSGVALQVTGGRYVGATAEHIQTALQTNVVEGVGRKGCLQNSKRDLLRQKTFHFEKNYKGRMSKGAFKAKLTSWGGLVLDKKSKPPSDGVNSKNSSSPLPAANSKTPMSMPQEKAKSTQKPQIDTPAPPKTAEYYYAGIPYDEAQGKYIARDEKDEMLLAAVPRLQALQKEVQSWNDWANEKVMQAARRLSKDQTELKTLRQEKEETAKFTKEKQILEENTMKRLSEMEHALTTATGQIEMANSTVRRLEVENSVLKEEMEAASEKGLQEAAKLEEAVLREQEALKKSQSFGPQKALLQDELTALKCKTSELQQGIEKAKVLINQFEAQRAYEEREKKKNLTQAETIRKDRERLEALAKVEEDRVQQKAEKESQKYKDEMKKLEKEISELKLESEASKIAALRSGASLQGYQHPKVTKRLAVFRDNFGGGTVKQEHECVMCLTEEMSVVFLPCAHQVLCVDCNALHEKQGMKDCPSCRTPIQRRINACFAR